MELYAPLPDPATPVASDNEAEYHLEVPKGPKKLKRKGSNVSVEVGPTSSTAAHHHSAKAVMGAIIGNATICLLKFVAYAMTGSSSMLSEAIHSVADTMNQCLLMIGIRRSQVGKKEGPVGHYREAYVWALISSVGIFFLGAGVTIQHGITALLHPHHEINDEAVALVVLLIGFVVEGYTLLLAVRAVRINAKQNSMSFFAFVRSGSDPTAVAVVLEDSVAVLGVVIAAVSIWLSHALESMVFDAIGSIIIGGLLGFVATFLIKRNAELLTGVSPGSSSMKKFSKVLEDHPAVKRVVDLRGELIGVGVCRLKADLEFDGKYLGRQYLKQVDVARARARAIKSPEAFESFLVEFAGHVVETVAVVVDDIEKDVSAKVPGSVYIDLEAE